MVDLCAYRNLYSWEILSTKRPDCLPGGLIGTRHPFGADDKGLQDAYKCNLCRSFCCLKMMQFCKKNKYVWRRGLGCKPNENSKTHIGKCVSRAIVAAIMLMVIQVIFWERVGVTALSLFSKIKVKKAKHGVALWTSPPVT